jgi:hypothetical protein
MSYLDVARSSKIITRSIFKLDYNIINIIFEYIYDENIQYIYYLLYNYVSFKWPDNTALLFAFSQTNMKIAFNNLACELCKQTDTNIKKHVRQIDAERICPKHNVINCAMKYKLVSAKNNYGKPYSWKTICNDKRRGYWCLRVGNFHSYMLIKNQLTCDICYYDNVFYDNIGFSYDLDHCGHTYRDYHYWRYKQSRLALMFNNSIKITFKNDKMSMLYVKRIWIYYDNLIKLLDKYFNKDRAYIINITDMTNVVMRYPHQRDTIDITDITDITDKKDILFYINILKQSCERATNYITNEYDRLIVYPEKALRIFI